MVRTLAQIVERLRIPAAELAGLGAVVYGTAQFDPRAGWIAAGVGLLAKSFEWDLSRPRNEDR